MTDKFFTVRDYPNDVFCAVGKIIKYSQEWERDFKQLANLYCLPLKKINNSSLNKLNEAFKKEGFIGKKEFSVFKEVIKFRNYINHDFFLKDFSRPFEEIEEILNMAQFLIFEATDVTNNKIDALKGDNIMRPTVFDNSI